MKPSQFYQNKLTETQQGKRFFFYKEGGRFTTTGVWAELGNDTVQITELPVNTSIKLFGSFPYFEDSQTITNVNFEVTFKEGMFML